VIKKRFRKVYFYKHYYEEFYKSLDERVKLKVNWTIELIETVDSIPRKYFDHIAGTDGLFEIRVEYSSNIYRIFCFFDAGKLIIAINGFQKKTQKTPRNEIERAKRIKRKYFDEKKEA